MNKPLTIACEDFKQDMASLINNSNLPPILIESVLQNYLNEISMVAKRQYQLDKIEYEKTLKDSMEKASIEPEEPD